MITVEEINRMRRHTNDSYHIEFDDICGNTFENVLKALLDNKAHIPPKGCIGSVFVAVNNDYIKLSWQRMETDEEVKKRIQFDINKRLQQEEADYKRYLQLDVQFGDRKRREYKTE